MTAYFCGFHFDIKWQQGQFFAAVGALSFVLTDNFVWRSKVWAVI